MKNRLYTYIILCFLFCFCLACENKTDYTESAYLIEHVQIVDVENGSVSKPMSVLIDQGKIQQIESPESFSDFPQHRRTNAAGKFMMPGMWDAHVHLDQLASTDTHRNEMLKLYTLNGITSLREMGGDWRILDPMRSLSKKSALYPSIYSAGPILENKKFIDWIAQEDPKFPELRIGLMEVTDVEPAVDSLISIGVDLIKIRTAPSAEVFLKLAEVANARGILFAGHVDAKVNLLDAVNAGISSLEHLDIFQLSGMSDAGMDSVVQAMEINNTFYSPTLTYFKKYRIYDRNQARAFLSDSLFTHELRQYASRSLIDKSKQALGWAVGSPLDWVSMEANFLKFGRKLVDSDVKFLASTDGANGLVLPGFSLHEELRIMAEEFGLTNAEALRSATIHPAEYFGWQDHLGLVKVGYEADLVLLDENPLKDLRNTETIHAVIHQGTLIDPQTIKKELAAISRMNKAQYGQ